jgi:hypothetical protein
VARRKKKPSNQLELDFTLKSGKVKAGAVQMEFDFFNQEMSFYGQLYHNKAKLKVDLLKLFLADKINKINKSKKPVRRVLFFKSEVTRKRVTSINQSILKQFGIETATIKNAA